MRPICRSWADQDEAAGVVTKGFLIEQESFGLMRAAALIWALSSPAKRINAPK